MSHSFTIAVPPNAPKQTAAYVESLIQAPTGGIGIYIIDPAPIYRQVEIVNAWRFLYQGIRDRALWPSANFGPGNLYSSVPIDSVTEEARLTALNTGAVFLPNHIAIGINTELRLEPTSEGAPDATNIYELFFDRLIDFAREHALFKADGTHWNTPIPGIALDAPTAGFVVDTPGTYSVTPVRTPGPVMEAHEVTGSFATVRDLYDAFMRNTPTSWTPYYDVHQDGAGVPYLELLAVPGEHTSITETWV